jgi:hypothetical protein
MAMVEAGKNFQGSDMEWTDIRLRSRGASLAVLALVDIEPSRSNAGKLGFGMVSVAHFYSSGTNKKFTVSPTGIRVLGGK